MPYQPRRILTAPARINASTPPTAGRAGDPRAPETPNRSRAPTFTVVDKDRLKRWMNLEIRKTNQATVTTKERLGELIHQEDPSLERRDGSPHTFDPEALERLYEALSPFTRAELELPITFYLSHKAADNCYVQDDTAIRALEQIDVARTSPREGKLWMSTPLARAFARDWPTIAQFLIT